MSALFFKHSESFNLVISTFPGFSKYILLIMSLKIFTAQAPKSLLSQYHSQCLCFQVLIFCSNIWCIRMLTWEFGGETESELSKLKRLASNLAHVFVVLSYCFSPKFKMTDFIILTHLFRDIFNLHSSCEIRF